MAKITFESGDVVSYIQKEGEGSEDSSETHLLGVALDERRWVKFTYRYESRKKLTNGIDTPKPAELCEIPEGALPVDLDKSVPFAWNHMFQALILIAKEG